MMSDVRLMNIHRKLATACSTLGLVVAVTCDVHAQAADGQEPVSGGEIKRGLAVVPRVSVAETFSDNARLTNNDQRADQITEISPGIRITSDGGRVKGYFDYALRELIYAQNSYTSTTQNSLNTFGTVEAVEKWAYLDFSGTISQQAISAFGTQSVGNTAANVNLTETSSYRLSPYVRGRLTDAAEYEARYTQWETRSKSSLVPDVTSKDGLVKVGSGSAFRVLGWSGEASRQSITYGAGRNTQADRLRAVVTYAANPQFRLSAIGGREANNYTTINKESYASGGFGVDWTPSERTKLSAFHENRFFGDGHNLSIEHRTARTVWRFSDVRDVYATPSQTGFGRIGSVYDIFYSQFASLEPDPVKRAQLVNDFLQSNGINPNTTIVSSFLSSAASVQRLQDVSFSLLGARDTVTFMATRRESRRLDTLSTVFDDLSNSTVLIQHGFNVGYAHRLTPQSSLNMLLSQQKTSGATTVQEATLRSVNLSVSTRLDNRTSAMLGLRRVVFDSIASPYVESAVTGSLTVQF